MTKKKNKLDRAWCGWVIDLVLGPHMMMLGMREPAAAEKLNNILVRMLSDMYALDKYKDKKKQFVQDASQALTKLFGDYMMSKLYKYLEEGLPKSQQIIRASQPIGGGPRRMQ